MTASLPLHITDETSRLISVVLGHADDRHPEPQLINPKIVEAVAKGTYPSKKDLEHDIASFYNVLVSHGVKVLRPSNVHDQGQVFPRDIGFVIDDTFVVCNMKENSRVNEIKGIAYILNQIPSHKILHPPKDVIIEGGDVILWNEYVFVGIGMRSNLAGYEYVKTQFPHKKVVPLYMKETSDPLTNVLHLDCAFQPIGKEDAIIYEEGFIQPPKVIHELFDDVHLIRVSSKEMYDMFPNVFSISTNQIVVDSSFVRLVDELSRRGYEVIEVKYRSVSILGGLLRCSTLPLQRINE